MQTKVRKNKNKTKNKSKIKKVKDGINKKRESNFENPNVLYVSLNKNANFYSLILPEFNITIKKNQKIEISQGNKKLIDILEKYKNWKIINFS